MPLEQRSITTNRLILGCMPFGGEWTRDPVTKEDLVKAEKAFDAALSIGITMFDHADFYTMGKSEQSFGHILKSKPSLRDQIVIQSKCGKLFADESAPYRYDFSKQHILNAVDGTLQRLQINYLDILLLHRPDPLLEPEEIAEAFDKLRASGKVRYFGTSNMSLAQICFIQQVLPDPLVVNQLELSLAKLDWIDQTVHVNQQAGASVNFPEGLMEYSQMEKLQIQAWGPLAQGRFSGRSTDNESVHIRQTAALVARMAEEKDTTPEAIVLGWLMRHPAMPQPVIGTTNPERIVACQDAERQSKQMTREEWYTLYASARGKQLP